MKKAILGLAALVSSSCLPSIDDRAIELTVKECNNITTKPVYYVKHLDSPADGKYLTLPQIERVVKVIEEKTDCHLSVYFDRVEGDLDYILQKKNSEVAISLPDQKRYVKLYLYDSNGL